MQKIRPVVFLAKRPALPATFKTSISDNLFVLGPLIKLVKIRLLAQVFTPSVKAEVTTNNDIAFLSYSFIISFFIYLGIGDI